MLRGMTGRRRRKGVEGCSMLVDSEQEGGDGPPHMKGVPSGDHLIKQEAGDEEETAGTSNGVQTQRHMLVFSLIKPVYSFLRCILTLSSCFLALSATSHNLCQ